jgi:two-component system KDP operon response regulator KdpE
MSANARVLVIDDDTGLCNGIAIYLRQQGFEYVSAQSGLEGLRALYERRPEVVLLDIMMPNMDGFTVCERIRELSDVPIIILSGRASEEDRVRGLACGADDYVVKPFSLRELVARIEAVLRRERQSETTVAGHVFVDQDLYIDAARWEVCRDGEIIRLTPTEMKFLLFMAENANQVLTHRQILQHVWGDDYLNELHYTKLFAWRLRCKIERDPDNPRYILTERGIGYRFCLEH